MRKQALSCLVSTCRQQIQKYTSAAAPVNEATLANDMDLPARIISNALLQAFARDNDDGLKNFASGAVSELLFAPLESRKDKRLPCVWEILSRFSHEHLQLLARVSALLSKQHLIKPSVVKTLQVHHLHERLHWGAAPCAVRKVGWFGPVFPDGQGGRGNYCVPIHRTAQILTQPKNSHNDFKTNYVSH